MKKFRMCMLSVLLLTLLSGCCLSVKPVDVAFMVCSPTSFLTGTLFHKWTEATCTTPKTCSRCGKTEGEALGHTTEAATCTVGETCTVCGEVLSQPLGHELGEQYAVYNEKKKAVDYRSTCSVCSSEITDHSLSLKKPLVDGKLKFSTAEVMDILKSSYAYYCEGDSKKLQMSCTSATINVQYAGDTYLVGLCDKDGQLMKDKDSKTAVSFCMLGDISSDMPNAAKPLALLVKIWDPSLDFEETCDKMKNLLSSAYNKYKGKSGYNAVEYDEFNVWIGFDSSQSTWGAVIKAK